MGAVKRQVNDILDLWAMGRSLQSIAVTCGVPVDVVEYVINEYGTDAMPA